MDIAGRVVVVTGGGNGIGEALCRAFADQGARAVVVADLDASDAERTAAAIRAAGGSALAVPTDVGVEAEVVGLVRRTEAEIGPIDLFCANAGIMVLGGVEVPDDEWAAHLAGQRGQPHLRGPSRAPGDAGPGRGLPAPHRLGRRPADPDRLGAVLRDQARRGGAGRVVVDHARRCRPPGLVPVPAGGRDGDDRRRAVAAEGRDVHLDGRPGRRAAARGRGPRRARGDRRASSSSSSPTPRWPRTSSAGRETGTGGCGACAASRRGCSPLLGSHHATPPRRRPKRPEHAPATASSAPGTVRHRSASFSRQRAGIWA